MFSRIRLVAKLLSGKYISLEDQLAKERKESAWLHTCLRGLLLQAGGAGRITEATQMRMITCDQIWITRPYRCGDLVVLLADEKKTAPSHLIAAIQAR